MLRLICIFLFTILQYRLLNGQPLSADHRVTVETALMEQRILAHIRPLLGEYCNVGHGFSDQLLELKNAVNTLTKRIEDVEEGMSVINTGISVCSDYLVSGLYGLKDEALSASSSWNFDHGQQNSRLYHETDDINLKSGSWSSQTNDLQQYIQVQFPRETEVNAILLRGRNNTNYNQWVKTYHVLYSLDGTTWTKVMSTNNQPKLFTGNSDITTIIKADIVPSITAMYLRINPRSWHNHISTRFDVSGCYNVSEKRNRIHNALGFKQILDDGTLYRVNEHGENQLNATKLCTQQYSKLIKVDSLRLMSSLQAVVRGNDILRNAHNQLYVSGKYVDTWLYSDDSGVIDSDLWSPGNPDPSQGHCVMLTLTGLSSVGCTEELFSVCGHV